jgi:nitronate monooxygenase
MPLPSSINPASLRLPVIMAPMFLLSDPALVIAALRAGIIGSFPALNQRSLDGLDAWLTDIDQARAAMANPPPYAVNLIVHKSAPRTPEDLQLVIKHKVPIVITSLGAVSDVVKAVQDYGGIVFHDVISERHMDKAIAAGVDGLVLVCAGAGGHTGTLNPFAFTALARRKFNGTIIVSGGISDGYGIAAVKALGADFAYMGTRFIATQECRADPAYKQMIIDAQIGDISGTAAVSGVYGNFLNASLAAAGIDPASSARPELNMEQRSSGAWKQIWSAGHGAGVIDDIPTVAALVERLAQEYALAQSALS